MTDEGMQTLYCTECDRTIEFEIKKEKSGNLIIVCDHCGHQHCRVVVDGIVTSDRWSSRETSVSTQYGAERNSR